MTDPRVWNPDESCRPFFWNTCANVTNLGKFRVPMGHIAVITSLSCSNGASGEDLSNFRVALLRDDLLLDNEGMRLAGAVTDSEQHGSDGVSHNGIAIIGDAGERSCRIVLEDGVYRVWLVNAPASANVAVSFSGHLYKRNQP